MSAQREEYDGIVVGGGHQGLVCAAYMARAGYDTLVVEHDLKTGGGIETTDPTGRGFRFNFCGKGHYGITGTPWYDDLNLADHGVEYLQPKNDWSLPSNDDPHLVLSKDDDTLYESLSQFSDADAEQFLELRETANELMDRFFLAQRFDEPIPADERRDLLDSSELGRTFLRWSETPFTELLDEWFETEKVKFMLMQKLSVFGQLGAGVDSPAGAGNVVRLFESRYGYEIVRGGAGLLAQGLVEVIQQNGGSVRTVSTVESIDVEDGAVAGVTLTDGRSYGAREFVVSSLNPPLTFDDLVGYEHLTEEFIERVEDFEWERRGPAEIHFGLEEPPEYEGSEEFPAVNEGLYQLVGIESYEDMQAVQDTVEAEEIAPDGFTGITYSRHDPSVAPPGKHTASAVKPTPYRLHGDLAEWDREGVIDELESMVLETWQEYAPNMTEDNVITTHTKLPHHREASNPNMYMGRGLIGHHSQAQILDNHVGYRAPVDGLFTCSSACHPGGGISGAAGYIVAKVVHEELGKEPWWDPMDAREAFANAE